MWRTRDTRRAGKGGAAGPSLCRTGGVRRARRADRAVCRVSGRRGLDEVDFRKAGEKDIDVVMGILADGRAALKALGIDQWQGGYPHRAVVEGDVARGESYLAEDAGEAVATVMVGFSGERIYDGIVGGAWLTDSPAADPGYGVVHRVAVSLAHRGRGAASFLLEQAEALTWQEGLASVRIDTHPGNLPMRRLLLKRGYVECGTVYIDHAEGATPDRVAYEKLLH